MTDCLPAQPWPLTGYSSLCLLAAAASLPDPCRAIIRPDYASAQMEFRPAAGLGRLGKADGELGGLRLGQGLRRQRIALVERRADLGVALGVELVADVAGAPEHDEKDRAQQVDQFEVV